MIKRQVIGCHFTRSEAPFYMLMKMIIYLVKIGSAIIWLKWITNTMEVFLSIPCAFQLLILSSRSYYRSKCGNSRVPIKTRKNTKYHFQSMKISALVHTYFIQQTTDLNRANFLKIFIYSCGKQKFIIHSKLKYTGLYIKFQSKFLIFHYKSSIVLSFLFASIFAITIF